jgi:hypothetical protein
MWTINYCPVLNRIQPQANQDNDYGRATNKFTFKLHKRYNS